MQKYFALPQRKTSISSMEEINSFEKLRDVVVDMTDRKSELGIEGVFASTSFSSGEDWRWQTHLANLPVYYEFRDKGISDADTIQFSYANEYKNIFDLYVNYSCTAKNDLMTKSVNDSMQEFALGKVAMVQNGNWAWGQISATEGNVVKEEDIHFLPIYTGVDGEESPTDPLAREVLAYMADKEKTSVSWNFTAFPNQQFKDNFGNTLLQYARGEIEWAHVVERVCNDWVIFVQSDAADVLAPVFTINTICAVVGLLLLLVSLVLGYILTTVITRPIVSLTAVINDISELNMSNSTSIPKSNDEIGRMGNAILHMRKELSDIVSELNNIAEILVGDSDTLYTISENVNQASTDNAATNEELAASMEETSISTDSINTSIQNMNLNVSTVADKIQNGTVLTNEIMDKTLIIHQHTRTSSDETLRVYDSIRKTSDEAITKAREVEKINQQMTKSTN